MTMFTEDQARAICQKVVKLSKADECTAELSGGTTGNVRFALNNVSTSGIVSNSSLSVQVAFGKRSGVATLNQYDDASLERVVRRAEDLARLAPENPEFVPALGPQNYRASGGFSAGTAAITPDYRAEVATASIAPCRANKMTAAGFLEDSASFSAFANSRGNSGYTRGTEVDYTCTVRTDDGRGSGWVGRNVQDIAAFSAASEVQTAVRKAGGSVDAKAIEPGKYTVILEPVAAAGLIASMIGYFSARSADEGRSFLSKKGGGNRLGEQVFGPQINIMSDAFDPRAAVDPWDNDYVPRERIDWVRGGKVENLEYSRYWAQKQGKRATASPGNLLISGGTKSTADLIRSTDRGILVTRTWYIRMVDPQTVLLTGL
ncbi:MAG: TldD/PmbA family protein, partial [Sphingomonadaceae bacterium]|nr:TldD/PmbA family protein [Sphingomonadaceae bacterium]